MDHKRVNVGESERWLSVIAGGMLALGSLRRSPLTGGLMALAGGVMIYRGLTGHCPAFAALGIGDRGEELDAFEGADPVDQASMESFPASDAPAWTP